jgi:hypothetical protein
VGIPCEHHQVRQKGFFLVDVLNFVLSWLFIRVTRGIKKDLKGPRMES